MPLLINFTCALPSVHGLVSRICSNFSSQLDDLSGCRFRRHHVLHSSFIGSLMGSGYGRFLCLALHHRSRHEKTDT
ncbi:hypothetical protein B0H14DRAFT_2814163, partial [Mycena olivaceomarginata]